MTFHQRHITYHFSSLISIDYQEGMALEPSIDQNVTQDIWSARDVYGKTRVSKEETAYDPLYIWCQKVITLTALLPLEDMDKYIMGDIEGCQNDSLQYPQWYIYSVAPIILWLKNHIPEEINGLNVMLTI